MDGFNLQCYKLEIDSIMKDHGSNFLNQHIRDTYMKLYCIIPTSMLIKSRTCEGCGHLMLHPLPIGLCTECEKKLNQIIGV